MVPGFVVADYNRLMNIEQAKTLSLSTFLSALGFSPARPRNQSDELWYYSPFRDERTPSFKVKGDRVWYDHGIGQGGTIIEFVMQYRHTNSVSDALLFLSDYDRRTIGLTVAPKRQKRAKDRQIQVIEVSELRAHALIYYLKSQRHIDVRIAKKHLRQVDFSVGESRQFALGFANRLGGWELRNRYFKGSSSPKDLSVIKSVYNPHSRLAVFEGFMDYLSLLTLLKRDHLACDVMVLNSVVLAKRAKGVAADMGYQDVYTYFDNDEAGMGANEVFCGLPCPVISQHRRYEPHNDLNAFLVHSRSQQLTR